MGTVLLGLAAVLPLTGDEPLRAQDREATSAPAVPQGSVADRVRLGDAESEAAHQVTSDGASDMQTGTVEQGQLTERFTARSVAAGGRFTARLQAAKDQPLTLQFRELRPNDAWGASFGSACISMASSITFAILRPMIPAAARTAAFSSTRATPKSYETVGLT